MAKDLIDYFNDNPKIEGLAEIIILWKFFYGLVSKNEFTTKYNTYMNEYFSSNNLKIDEQISRLFGMLKKSTKLSDILNALIDHHCLKFFGQLDDVYFFWMDMHYFSIP